MSGRTQSSASTVLVYSNMFWQEATMEGYKVNKSGEGHLDGAIWLLGTKYGCLYCPLGMASPEPRLLTWDAELTLSLYLYVQNYLSDFSYIAFRKIGLHFICLSDLWERRCYDSLNWESGALCRTNHFTKRCTVYSDLESEDLLHLVGILITKSLEFLIIIKEDYNNLPHWIHRIVIWGSNETI